MLIWQEFRGLQIAFTPSAELANHAVTLALDHMGAFYDSLYIALAIREDLKVLTADQRMVNAFAKLDRTVWLGDFKAP